MIEHSTEYTDHNIVNYRYNHSFSSQHVCRNRRILWTAHRVLSDGFSQDVPKRNYIFDVPETLSINFQ